MDGKPRTPLDGYSVGAVIAKFLGAGFFGILVDVAILLFTDLWMNSDILSSSVFWWVLVCIPIVWGVLGVFFLERMLDLGKSLVEGLVGSGGNRRRLF